MIFWSTRRMKRSIRSICVWYLGSSENNAKFSKCEFWLKELGFLEHVISGEGIAEDPAKVDTVTNWESPTSVGEIRSFLGLVG